MTRPYEFEIEVRPMADDGHARRVLEHLRAAGLSIDDDNYCQTDDSRGHVFQGTTELSGGVLPEDVHQSVAKTLGPGVQVTSRWRDLDPSDWDEEFGPAGRVTEESAGENEQIAEVPEMVRPLRGYVPCPTAAELDWLKAREAVFARLKALRDADDAERRTVLIDEVHMFVSHIIEHGQALTGYRSARRKPR